MALDPIGYHIRTRLRDNRVIVCTQKQRRIVARVVLHQGRHDGLLAFSLPDTHLHLLALCNERAAGRLAQRIESSLKQTLALPVPFVSYPHEPIRDQQHLYNGFRYNVRQHERHGLDAAEIMESTNLPDLLGLRIIGAYTRTNVRQHLPRIREQTLREWCGMKSLREAHGPLEAISGAALAATALQELSGRSRKVVQARRAMLEVMGKTTRRAIAAELLGVVERSVYLLQKRPADPNLVRAIRLQLGLRQLLLSRA